MRQKAEDEEGNNLRTNQYLVEEHEKIKLQKAQLRCDYMQLKREHQELLDKFHEASGPSVMMRSLALGQRLMFRARSRNWRSK